MTAGKIEQFEDLIAWQKARELTKVIYMITLRQPFARDFGLASQIQRASVSIMANIAEGFDRHRPGEFHQFLSMAKASCAELRSHLYVALDTGYIKEDEFEALRDQALITARVVNGLRASVAKRAHGS